MSIISCNTNSDCDFNFYCNNDLECVHNDLWPPTVIDVITYLLIPIIVGVGNVGGLGGGIIKVPLLMIMLNYQSKVATFIAYCVLFGSCLANSTLLMFKKHPSRDEPIIDYNIVLVINPMVLLGTNLGIYLNILLPEVAAGILFIVFLTIVSPIMFKKGVTLYRLKKEAQKCELAEKLLNNEEQDIHNQTRCDKSGGDPEISMQDITQANQINNDVSDTADRNRIISNDKLKENKNKQNDSHQVEVCEEIQPQNLRKKNDSQRNISKSINQYPDLIQKSIMIDEKVKDEKFNSYFVPSDTAEDNQRRKTIILQVRSATQIPVIQAVDKTTTNELEEFYQEKGKQVPWKKLILLIIVFMTVQMLVFFRGGKGLKSLVGIEVCTPSFWIVNCSIVAVAFCANFVIRYFLFKQETLNKQIIQKYSLQDQFEGDFDCFNNIQYIKTSIAGLIAGTLAGTFGVGAGLALVPILLAAGVHPQVAAATCGFNYFFISTTTIIQVFTNGYLDIYQITLFSILSFIGGFGCAKIIYAIVEKKKASYVVVFIVFGLAVLNILSFIIYLAKKGHMYGWDSLVKQIPFCEAL